jgi:hypothetical protein
MPLGSPRAAVCGALIRSRRHLFALHTPSRGAPPLGCLGKTRRDQGCQHTHVKSDAYAPTSTLGRERGLHARERANSSLAHPRWERSGGHTRIRWWTCARRVVEPSQRRILCVAIVSLRGRSPQANRHALVLTLGSPVSRMDLHPISIASLCLTLSPGDWPPQYNGLKVPASNGGRRYPATPSGPTTHYDPPTTQWRGAMRLC